MDSRVRVLVCDDSTVERTLLSGMIKKLGYEVQTVKNGKEVLVEIELHNYNLLFLDLIMPVLDGWETSIAIRKIEKYKDTPIVAVSSISTSFDIEKAKMCGINKIITKPFNIDTIQQILNELLT